MNTWDRKRLEGILKTILDEEESRLTREVDSTEAAEFRARSNFYVDKGKEVFGYLRKETSELAHTERVSYFLGYLKGVEDYPEDKKCFEITGKSLKELESTVGEITKRRKELWENNQRTTMIESPQEYLCGQCEAKINPENCYFSSSGGIYCNEYCFTLFTSD